MKKLFLLALVCLSAQAFGQVCEVDMVYQNRSIIRTFRAYDCIEAKKECRKSIRLDYSRDPRYPNGSLDCVQRGTNYPNPNPNPYPNPNPNPYPQPDISRYMYMSDWELAQEALYYGVGRCTVTQGSYNSACNYYVRLNGIGFPAGTGCAKPEYAYQYGCRSSSEFENAGCLTRIALQRRQCL